MMVLRARHLLYPLSDLVPAFRTQLIATLLSNYDLLTVQRLIREGAFFTTNP